MQIDESLWVSVAFILFLLLVWKKITLHIKKMLDDKKKDITFEINQARELREQAQVELNDSITKRKDVMIEIKSDVGFNLNLIEKDESLYYMEKTLVPVLQVSFSSDAKIFSKIIFKN